MLKSAAHTRKHLNKVSCEAVSPQLFHQNHEILLPFLSHVAMRSICYKCFATWKSLEDYHTCELIDLFRLYVSFSHFRQHDFTITELLLVNVILMHIHPRAYVCITYEKAKDKFLENTTWSELGRENKQAKKVYGALNYW